MDTVTTGDSSPALDAAGSTSGWPADGAPFQSAHEEAQYLFELARRHSEVDRNALYDAVADLFERRESELLGSERALMLEILHRLTRDVEIAVRKQLAERLAKSPRAPEALIFMLANDEIDVCYEILVRSPVLKDSDLIEIVRHHGLGHQLGVAVRRDLSPEVSAVLVATGAEEVVVTLLENETARISHETMSRIVGASRQIEAYREPLVQRSDLPVDLAHKLLMWVSLSLREHIVRRFDIDPATLEDEIVEAAAAVATEDENRRRRPELSAVERLVAKLHAAGELTPAFAVKALAQGQVALFERAFAKLTDLGAEEARRIVFQRNHHSLAIACRAIGLDRAAFQALVRMLYKARETASEPAPEALALLLEFYDQVSPEAASLTLGKWRVRQAPGHSTDGRAFA
ncbi:MAG: DUF2336 domain-containing protein [Alphaproteobacteria bacterium]|nr:DUF2336 domain-containing protein [Alphaproteobacteria bacterium]